MKIRAVVLVVLLGLVLAFTVANWTAITAPTPLSLIVGRIEAPLGLILLMFLVGVTLAFLFMMVWQQAGAILETRRAAKELQAQRALADQAEASRFTELRKHLDARLDRIQADLRAPGDTLSARLDTLEAALREHIDHAGNTLAAYIGEVDDRVERLGGSAGDGAARAPVTTANRAARRDAPYAGLAAAARNALRSSVTAARDALRMDPPAAVEARAETLPAPGDNHDIREAVRTDIPAADRETQGVDVGPSPRDPQDGDAPRAPR